MTDFDAKISPRLSLTTSPVADLEEYWSKAASKEARAHSRKGDNAHLSPEALSKNMVAIFLCLSVSRSPNFSNHSLQFEISKSRDIVPRDLPYCNFNFRGDM
ncbi:T-complex 1 subunit gamma [Gossypium arboreum]|uniref:T-complex 1 subunit gamma n=1 Tax=Gossypium arboreum TaxID=29729 RepID=A0A0B0MTY8_GOSAR|nr:T-complex 1 subunit gamma [Gossypium arboreum]